MSASAQAKFDQTLSRFDSILTERVRREAEALEREDAAQRRADAEQVRADAYRCREIGAMYDPAFAAHGVQTPEPIDDERPGRFRRRLYDRLRRKLPPEHDLAGVRADDLPAGDAFMNFEEMLLQAATAEGEKPSFANLPDTGLISRTRVDDMGGKQVEFFGRRSFIAEMGRPGRLVQHIRNPRDNTVLWGRPLQQARWTVKN